MIALLQPREETPTELLGLLGAPEDEDRAPTIQEVGEYLSQFEQVEMPVEHNFSEGIYTRTIFMPANTYVLGHQHKTRHLNVILSGRAVVTMNGERHEIVAPRIFESDAGVQKILSIEEDMLWMTIHVNPTNERDIPTLEKSLVELPPSVKEIVGGMTLDALRMFDTRHGLALH